MITRCEICNKKITKTEFNSHATAAGNGKNKGECDSCSDEFREQMSKLLNKMVITTKDAIYIGKVKYAISEGENNS